MIVLLFNKTAVLQINAFSENVKKKKTFHILILSFKTDKNKIQPNSAGVCKTENDLIKMHSNLDGYQTAEYEIHLHLQPKSLK